MCPASAVSVSCLSSDYWLLIPLSLSACLSVCLMICSTFLWYSAVLVKLALSPSVLEDVCHLENALMWNLETFLILNAYCVDPGSTTSCELCESGSGRCVVPSVCRHRGLEGDLCAGLRLGTGGLVLRSGPSPAWASVVICWWWLFLYKCSELICVHGNSEACAYGCVRCVKTLWKQAERLIHTQNDGPLPLHSHTAPLTVHWALSRLSCHSVRTYSNMCVSRRVTTHAHTQPPVDICTCEAWMQRQALIVGCMRVPPM